METEFVNWLKSRLGGHERLRLGVGDDTALIDLGRRTECLLTVDMLTEGVDFRLAEVDPRRIGRKALAVNLSDIAAMAGKPLAAVVALALPREGALDLAVALYEGMLPLAEKYDVAIGGGDTNTWEGPLVISVTLLGQAAERGPLRRDGARPGDFVLVTGEFGGSILARHFDFEPRVAEAQLLHERYELHAAIDVSDGLSLDLSRLAEASGCGAAIRLDFVPIAAAARELSTQRSDGVTPLAHALGDGEDFELIVAAPPEVARRILQAQPLSVPITAIGEFVAEAGLWRFDDRGVLQTLAPRGYLH